MQINKIITLVKKELLFGNYTVKKSCQMQLFSHQEHKIK